MKGNAYLVLGALLSLQSLAVSVEYKEIYVDSKIDHFNPLVRNPNTFKQRMFVSEAFYDFKHGPILVYTGNEGAIEQFWNNTGFLMEVAREVKGFIVFIEHRYYGKSIPFGKDWQQNYNYQFLTVDQALADYAVILTNLKKELGDPNRKVIAFGGSYGGMLTAYMRFKYPDIVDGGLAASAPIFPMGKYDFFRSVTDDCHNYNAKCPLRVREAFSTILTMASQGGTGFEKLTSKFRLCSNLTAGTVQHFLLWIRNSFTTMAMVDYPYAADFLGNLPAAPINVTCDTILSADTAVDGLAAATVAFYNATSGPASCLDPAKEFMECADATGCGLMSQWDIQVCLQLRFPSGSNNVSDMFPPMDAWSPSDYQNYCSKKYGPGLSYQHDFFNVDFWSSRIAATSQLIFSNGDLDPWHTGGVLKEVTGARSVVPILIKGGAHHLDLRAAHVQDPVSVVDARDLEMRIIKSWLVSPSSK